MKKISILLFLSIFSMQFLHADDKPAMVVYDLTAKNIKKIKSTLFGGITSTSEYYSNDLKDLKAAVIIHGGAYRYFVKDPYRSKFSGDIELINSSEEITKMLKTLSENYNVEFYVCGAGLHKHNIQPIEIYDFIKIIPNAMIGLINKQNEGYAYVPIED